RPATDRSDGPRREPPPGPRITAGTGEIMTTTSTDRIAELEARLDGLADRVDKLTRALADNQAFGWEARVEQLRLQSALGRMELRSGFEPTDERLRNAFEAARAELRDVPELVVEAAGELRPAFERLERAFDEARRAITEP